MREPHPYKHRPVIHWLALFSFFFGVVALGGWQLLVHPNSPLPPEWNPKVPLRVDDPRTALTQWKLNRALSDDTACLAALETGTKAARRLDLEDGPQCGISPQVTLSSAAGATLDPVNTRCQTALRVAMWARHGLQPAAQDIFGQSLKQIRHFSSYSCRQIRTTSGSQSKMSSHATADAIDISGFVLADGGQVDLLRDWKGEEDKHAFLLRANESACEWFRVTLGPRYNSLHADHFHLQHTGWGLCR